MKRLFILVCILILGAVGLSSLYIVDQTEYAIVQRFGDPVRIDMEPGLRFKAPWPIDTVTRFDNRLMVLQTPRESEPDKEYLTRDEETGIGKNVEVTTYTCWRIRPDSKCVLNFLESMGDVTQAEAVLSDVIGSRLGAVLGEHDFSELVSQDVDQRQWNEILSVLNDRCRSAVDEYGIEIVDVRIERLNFPDQNRRNVFERMRAERQRIAARYRSEGEEKATAIRARANRERDEILATAYEEAERLRGQADAESARIYGNAYMQEPDFYEFLRTLRTYETIFDSKTTLILSPDSEFLKYLNPQKASLEPTKTP